MQSVSQWAPSCIGPYAQAVSANGLVHFAGQIGLDPPTMSLVVGGAEAQAMQCLLSCQAVSTAAKADLEQAMLGCTIYAAPLASAASTKACPHAAHQAIAAEVASSASSVFSRVQEMLAGSQQDDLEQPKGAETQLQDACVVQQTSPSLQRGSVMEHGGPQSSAQPASEEGSLLSEAASEDEEGYEASDQEEPEEEEEEGFMDEYLRQREAAATVPQPLLTYVEALALPKGAAVELQPIALSASQDDLHQGEAPPLGIDRPRADSQCTIRSFCMMPSRGSPWFGPFTGAR